MTDQNAATGTPDHALSFGAVADSYDRGRPGYPAEAARWMTSSEQVSVLELGAGTGKLTEQLLALGHDVHATDPDPQMLDVLSRRFPNIRASVGSAEEIPAPDNSCDVVVAAQCFHWFDPQRAIPEIVRVLRPGGRIAISWNERDESIPWVKKFGRLVGSLDRDHEPSDTLTDSTKFIMVENERFKHWSTVNRKTIWDLVRSRSHIAVLDEVAQQEKRAELLDFYDGYGRGMDGMQLPYLANCFRARVVKVRRTTPPASARSTPPPRRASSSDGGDLLGPLSLLDEVRVERRAPAAPARSIDDTAERIGPIEPPRDSGEDDDAMLLIDFR